MITIICIWAIAGIFVLGSNKDKDLTIWEATLWSPSILIAVLIGCIVVSFNWVKNIKL